MSTERKDNGEDDLPTPDSTTSEYDIFCIGDEVLMEKDDGKCYLGNIIKIDLLNDQYQVKFGDNTTTWSHITKLTKLSTGHEAICVKCKISRTDTNNDIAICDDCQRGYQQNCHYDEGNEDNQTPNSTTNENKTFCIGDDVLVEKNDGNFYLGTLEKIDLPNDRCQVRFGDNTTTWSPIAKLTELSTGPGVRCVKCKLSRTNADNDIVICDKCLKAYHQKCHYPPISGDCLLGDVRWECIKCTNRNLLPLENTTDAPAQPPPCSPKSNLPSENLTL